MNTFYLLLYAEILAFCFILVVCITGKVYQSEKADNSSLLLRFNICTIFAVLVNFLWVNVNGNTITSAITVKLTTAIYYFTLNTAFYFWMRFSEGCLYPDAGKVKSYVFISAVPYIVTNILVGASCVLDLIFTVDNLNNVQTGPIWVTEYIYIFAVLLWSAGTAFSFTNKTTDPAAKAKGTRLASFVILPFVCIMLHVFTKGSPLSIIALSLLSMFSYREIKQAEEKAAADEIARREQEYLARIEDAEQRAATSEQRRIAFLRRTIFDFSHPLMNINSLLEQAAEATDQNHLADCLNKIHSYNSYMSRMIADASEMSALEAGTMELNTTLDNLPENLAQLAEQLQIQADEKQVSFITDFSSIHDELVRFDAQRLNQILANLFDNALKNTAPEDEIRFDVQQVEPASPDVASFIFSISDNGRGLTKESAEQLFEVTDDENSDKSGLGLVIVKKLADLMDARLNVESAPKEGTVISLFCSFALPTEEELAEINAPEDDEAVEDDQNDAVMENSDAAEYNDEGSFDDSAEYTADDEEYSSEDDIPDESDANEETETEPIEQADQQPTDVDDYEPTEEELSILRGVTVLVADDNETLLNNARILLDSLGVTAELAVGGADAIEKVRNSRRGQFNMIFMDIRMPHINGYEAAHAIRSFDDPNLASLPIIAMDSNASQSDRQEAQMLGMSDLIGKPLKKRALVRIITKYY